VLPFTIADNLVLTSYHEPRMRADPAQRRGDPGDRRRADRGIRHPDTIGQRARGHPLGRQPAKVVVAREFARDLRLLVPRPPTRGLDVGSIEFIHRQAIAKRDAGTAILLISAELDEILELSTGSRSSTAADWWAWSTGGPRTRTRSAC